MAEEKQDQPLQVVPREQRPLAKVGYAFIPKTWEELYAYAKEIAQTDFVPSDLRGKPGAVLAAWQFGQEIGLAPMAALQSIAVINGRPSLWGDGALAIVRSSPLCEYVRELPPDETLTKGYGECTVKRKDDDVPVTRRFTKEMAVQAGLWGGKSPDPAKKKYEPWFLYPGRMLQMRARAWAMRDAIPEALRGIAIREEAEDTEPRDVTPLKDEPLQIPQAREETKEPAAETKTSTEPKSTEKEPPLGDVDGAAKELKGEKPDRKADALKWIEAANDGDFLAEKKWLEGAIKGLSQSDQLEICRTWNSKNKRIQDELEAATKDT